MVNDVSLVTVISVIILRPVAKGGLVGLIKPHLLISWNQGLDPQNILRQFYDIFRMYHDFMPVC